MNNNEAQVEKQFYSFLHNMHADHSKLGKEFVFNISDSSVAYGVFKGQQT